MKCVYLKTLIDITIWRYIDILIYLVSDVVIIYHMDTDTANDQLKKPSAKTFTIKKNKRFTADI